MRLLVTNNPALTFAIVDIVLLVHDRFISPKRSARLRVQTSSNHQSVDDSKFKKNSKVLRPNASDDSIETRHSTTTTTITGHHSLF